MHVVRKQEKEPRLKDFIRLELARLGSVQDGQAAGCLLVARSIDSPVVRALATYAVDLEAMAIKVRVILSSLDIPADTSGTPCPVWLATCMARWTRNARLIDAHEFLVIGSTAAWVGDSMRRDPQKRDAFEFFSPDNAAVAERGKVSFERLWALCDPVSRSHRWKPKPVVVAEPQVDAANAAAAAAAMDSPSIPTPSATRH